MLNPSLPPKSLQVVGNGTTGVARTLDVHESGAGFLSLTYLALNTIFDARVYVSCGELVPTGAQCLAKEQRC